ncbi:hypothetical protein PNOK_0148100 [Pyrrhoderma noxium]|uniref:Uncharacterized protein n=1 Tax=Pyrrhoderma noxium TaxID=2282107 RepID=A0A286UPT1_9AGAM|nr:hypothetical protein PNOK_0148100 [Pyrrhoderma noxium]
MRSTVPAQSRMLSESSVSSTAMARADWNCRVSTMSTTTSKISTITTDGQKINMIPRKYIVRLGTTKYSSTGERKAKIGTSSSKNEDGMLATTAVVYPKGALSVSKPHVRYSQNGRNSVRLLATSVKLGVSGSRALHDEY